MRVKHCLRTGDFPLIPRCFSQRHSAVATAGEEESSESLNRDRRGGTQMLAQQNTRPIERPRAHYLEGMP
jgi:hypothetical protein